MPTVEDLERMMDRGENPQIHPDGSVTTAMDELNKKMEQLKILATREKEQFRLAFYEGFMKGMRAQELYSLGKVDHDVPYDYHDIEIAFEKYWQEKQATASCNPPPQGIIQNVQ
jgi:hypothetical protein